MAHYGIVQIVDYHQDDYPQGITLRENHVMGHVMDHVMLVTKKSLVV